MQTADIATFGLARANVGGDGLEKAAVHVSTACIASVCVCACVRAYMRVRVLVCVHSWVGASVRLRAAYIIYIMCAYACVCK